MAEVKQRVSAMKDGGRDEQVAKAIGAKQELKEAYTQGKSC